MLIVIVVPAVEGPVGRSTRRVREARTQIKTTADSRQIVERTDDSPHRSMRRSVIGTAVAVHGDCRLCLVDGVDHASVDDVVIVPRQVCEREAVEINSGICMRRHTQDQPAQALAQDAHGRGSMRRRVVDTAVADHGRIRFIHRLHDVAGCVVHRGVCGSVDGVDRMRACREIRDREGKDRVQSSAVASIGDTPQ